MFSVKLKYDMLGKEVVGLRFEGGKDTQVKRKVEQEKKGRQGEGGNISQHFNYKAVTPATYSYYINNSRKKRLTDKKRGKKRVGNSNSIQQPF